MTTSFFLLLLLFVPLWRNAAFAVPTLQQDSSNLRRALQTATADLTKCLDDIPGDHVVVVPGDKSYSNAKECHNSARSDRTWMPKAVVKVTSTEQVAAAIQCASAAGVTVTPRSGAHGFENEACSGELIVDVSNLDSLQVDTDTNVVEFGAGHLHGQLYQKLIDYGLVVPGGTENSVGTAGLWLGCGRGPLTHVHGLSCDNMLGIEFVDANGTIRVANSTTDTDMFWMARGSGGEFPGVVTKFVAQGYDMPSEVFEVKISFRSDQVGPLVKAWTARLEELSEPSLSMFTNIHSYQGKPILAMACYSCTEAQKVFTISQLNEIADLAGGGFGINYWGGTWLDRLLKEDWDEYEKESDLPLQAEWPAVWSTLSNGAHMVPTTDASDEVIDVIQNSLETYGESFNLYMYSMMGPHISNVPLAETAYGGRDAKYVLHYKFIGDTTDAVKLPVKEVALALDEAGLPCKGFYNYADREFPCAAGSGDLWLEAHFSDVPRMRVIKEAEDPDDRFMSALKAEMWRSADVADDEVNQLMFIGWPGVGDWGGSCTCPNGAIYQVGDNSDDCQSLACVGGIAGTCSENNPGGAGYRVICDTSASASMSNPTASPSSLEPVSQSTFEPTLSLQETTGPAMAPILSVSTSYPSLDETRTSTPLSLSPVTLSPAEFATGSSGGSSSDTVAPTDGAPDDDAGTYTPAPVAQSSPPPSSDTLAPTMDLSVPTSTSTATSSSTLFATSSAAPSSVSSSTILNAGLAVLVGAIVYWA